MRVNHLIGEMPEESLYGFTELPLMSLRVAFLCFCLYLDLCFIVPVNNSCGQIRGLPSRVFVGKPFQHSIKGFLSITCLPRRHELTTQTTRRSSLARIGQRIYPRGEFIAFLSFLPFLHTMCTLQLLLILPYGGC